LRFLAEDAAKRLDYVLDSILAALLHQQVQLNITPKNDVLM
jgi:hypothetical protein